MFTPFFFSTNSPLILEYRHMECSVWETVASRLKKSMCKVFLGSAEEEMPISHKIRQYRALLRFAHPGEILWSVERAEEVVHKQGIWRGFMRQILIGSPRGLGIGLLEQSCNPSLAVPLWLRLPGGYPRPS